ncbi:uncharacterized [Tachysurus ichikawai]
MLASSTAVIFCVLSRIFKSMKRYNSVDAVQSAAGCCDRKKKEKRIKEGEKQGMLTLEGGPRLVFRMKG